MLNPVGSTCGNPIGVQDLRALYLVEEPYVSFRTEVLRTHSL